MKINRLYILAIFEVVVANYILTWQVCLRVADMHGLFWTDILFGLGALLAILAALSKED